MSKYRATVAERVAAAKHVQAKTTGVHQVQPAKESIDTDAWIAANPTKFERLKSPGDFFLDQSSVSGVRE